LTGLRKRLAGGGTALGTMVLEFNTPGLPRILASAACDFVLIDLEHSGWSVSDLRPMLAAARATDAVPIARVQGSARQLISPFLDAGAHGVMVPMVADAAEAAQVVRAARFAPHGERGFGLLYPDQLAGGVGTAIEEAEARTIVILQIETMSGLEHVEEIAAAPGVDALWIGQFDLSVAMGIPGAFDDAQMRAAEDRMLAACADVGIAAGVLVASAELAFSMLRRGFRMIALGTDIDLYGTAVREGLAALREDHDP
jgi:2-dehydro-3-deoxyglucarate aldolase/4-hydroxy-2-oxoheptanedioate aldolase